MWSKKISNISTDKGRKHFICEPKPQLKWEGVVHQFLKFDHNSARTETLVGNDI